MCYYKNSKKMGYKDDDIEFANRLLTRREELNDEEVTAWLKEKDHVELLDEIAAIRQKLSGQSYGENSEEEFLYLEKSIYDRKSRRMTLRWFISDLKVNTSTCFVFILEKVFYSILSTFV